ncbi:signal peptidase I [Alteromonas sp. 1_MG-2023]|uniref:signal peptidase I n=1 Tax=Alteromonas sp. 1_MG-2023 TaxID=3062669 RepID=UPI0026E210DF|nr:signal peptidase I [Alteromonas sp. 1_MG-2023]MDO6568661.1 signal peptidase I [Alteromonas sp. 1_MG-2023]
MKKQTGSFIKRNLPFILFVVLMFSFRSSVADYYHVPSGSMEPTIQVGDRIVVNKHAYTFELPFTDVVLAQTGDIARGDIVVIQSSAADTRLVKRVIAVAGDKVSLSNNTLTVNDEPAVIHRRNNYVFQENMGDSQRTIQLLPIKGARSSFNEVVVPEKHVLVMGDNRNNSVDSRYYGFIPVEEVQGQATNVAFSLDKENYYLPRDSRYLLALQ